MTVGRYHDQMNHSDLEMFDLASVVHLSHLRGADAWSAGGQRLAHRPSVMKEKITL